MSEPDVISIRGAKEHNLKNVSLEIPKKKLVVFTGVSGSGKSSLAFDTLYAEGQRRYVESLSAYARQFLGQMEKPKYDTIRGLSPTISIEQKAASNNPRSTVGTVTEVHDYLRVLYASIGRAALPQLRPQGGQAERAADRRRDPRAARGHQGDAAGAAGAATARASTRTSSPRRRSAASPARASTAR